MGNNCVDYFGKNLFEDQNLEVSTPRLEENNEILSNYVSGKLIGVSESNYRRIWIRKLYDKIVYNQRMSDVVNCVIVRTKVRPDYIVDTHMYVYGKLGSGVSELKVGSNVSGYGKFDSKNRFLINQLVCDDVKIDVQLEWNDISWWLTPLLFIVLLLLFPVLINGILNNEMLNDLFSQFLLLFLGGFAIIKKFSGKILRYRMGLLKRIKLYCVGGAIFSIIMMSIL